MAVDNSCTEVHKVKFSHLVEEREVRLCTRLYMAMWPAVGYNVDPY